MGLNSIGMEEVRLRLELRKQVTSTLYIPSSRMERVKRVGTRLDDDEHKRLASRKERRPSDMIPRALWYSEDMVRGNSCSAMHTAIPLLEVHMSLAPAKRSCMTLLRMHLAVAARCISNTARRVTAVFWSS